MDTNTKCEDEMLPFLGQVLMVNTIGHNLPIHGRLIGLSATFLTFERADGRSTLIHRNLVLSVVPLRKHDLEAER